MRVSERPIEVVARITGVISAEAFYAELPNGAPVVAHWGVAKGRENKQRPLLTIGDSVVLELTPYDFSHGRIRW